MNSAADALDKFAAAMREHGLELHDGVIAADGALHRFRVAGDKSGSENGWYCLHVDGLPAGAFGCWKRDISATWCAKDRGEMTEAERQQLSARIEAMRRAREAEQLRVREVCQAKAAGLWGTARDTVAADHPYLVRKCVRAFGLRQPKNALLVPVQDAAGVLVGLQFIQPDGSKRFLTGTAKAGAFHRISGAGDRVLVCEGYATGASLHEASGLPVVIAFDAGNLLPVVQSLRQQLPDAALVLCAGDDAGTEGNVGLSKARAAAAAVGSLLAVPDFSADRPAGVTDFNDLHQHLGIEAVTTCIAAAAIPDAGDTGTSTASYGEQAIAAMVTQLAGLSPLEYDRVALFIGSRPASSPESGDVSSLPA